MTRLSWGDAGSRLYETGADRGVLYPNSGPGVPWYGLISVSEEPTGGEPQPFYLDGVKYLNVSAIEEFAATIEAYASPPEFAECDGTVALHKGLFASQQPRKSFGFSYRTLIGNDVDGTAHGYKIHLVYNAMAGPSSRSNQTIGDSVEPTTYSWPIEAVPFDLPGIKPTAHLVIDSTLTDPSILSILEGYLYGSAGIEPRLPTAAEVEALFGIWNFSGLSSPIKFLGVMSGAKTTIKNLLTNPSMENTAGTVFVRENLASDPRATTNGLITGQARWAPRWFGTVGAGTVTVVANATDGPEVAPGIRISTYLRKTWTTGAGVGDTGFDHTQISPSTPGAGTTALPVIAGVTYTASSYLRARTANTGAKFYMRIVFRNAAGERIVGPQWGGNEVLAVNDVWTRVSFTVTAPENAVSVSIATDMGGAGSWAPNDTLDGTGLDVEAASTISQYIDGQTQIQLRRNFAVNPAAREATGWITSPGTDGVAVRTVETTGGPEPGDKWVKMSWTTPPSGGNRRINLDSTTVPGSIIPGETYTVSVMVWSSVNRSLVLTIDWATPNGVWIAPQSIGPTVSVDAGVWKRLSITGVAPPTASRLTGFVNALDSLGGAIGTTKVVIEKTASVLPYIDGDSPGAVWAGVANQSESVLNDTDLLPFWMGSANSSTSVIIAAAVAGVASTSTGTQLRQYSTLDTPYQRSRALRSVLLTTGAIGIPVGEFDVTVGMTYTILMMVRPKTRATAVTPRIGNVLGSSVTLEKDKWTEVRLTVVAGSGTLLQTGLLLVGNAGHQIGDLIDVGVALLTDGVYTGPYFDGSLVNGVFVNGQFEVPKWDDRADASTSTLQLYQNLPLTSNPGDTWLIDGRLFSYQEYWKSLGAFYIENQIM